MANHSGTPGAGGAALPGQQYRPVAGEPVTNGGAAADPSPPGPAAGAELGAAVLLTSSAPADVDEDEPPEFTPDDEAEHIVVPFAAAALLGLESATVSADLDDPVAKPATVVAPATEENANAAANQAAARKKKALGPAPGGVCGAALLDRGLFVMTKEPPENFPVLKPCPGKDSPDRRLLLRGRLRTAANGSGKDGDSELEKENDEGGGGGGRRGLSRGISPCPRPERKDEEDDEAAAAAAAKAKKKSKRTWTYYPPPNGDEDLVPVDVIDHESEVLIVRREPPAQPRREIAMSANVSRRSHAIEPSNGQANGQSNKFMV